MAAYVRRTRVLLWISDVAGESLDVHESGSILCTFILDTLMHVYRRLCWLSLREHQHVDRYHGAFCVIVFIETWLAESYLL